MTTPTPPRDIRDLDVPLAAVAADLSRLAEERRREGALAEQQHQVFDLDPDSTCVLPGCMCPTVPPRTGGAA